MSWNLKAAVAALAISLPLQLMAEEAASAQPTAPAAKVKTADLGKSLNPWTDCGIGAMLFTETKWAAVISNVIWDYGTTATSSAVSSKHTCEGKVVALARFIDETYVSLEEETAIGKGDHLNAMLNIRGCEATARAAIVGDLRSGLATSLQDSAYAGKSRSEKAQGYYQLLETTLAAHQGQCDA